MVHTFELSKMISRDTFNEVVHSLKLKYYRHYWFTTAYSDKGFAAIRLFKFKRKETKAKYKKIATSHNGGKDLSEKKLFNLVDILSAYGDQMEDYQKHGVLVTDEDIKKIKKL